jgi:hypothetical protein
MSEQILDQQEEKQNATSKNIEDNSSRAKVASILILVLTFTNLPLLWTEISFLEAMQEGIPNNIEEAELITGFIGLVQILLNILCIIFFIRWFKRAYTNLSLRVPTETTPGMTIGAWFIPIVSLYKPFQIMKEMWTKSIAILTKTYEKKDAKSSNGLLGIWWLLWIVVNIGANVTMQISSRTKDIEHLITAGKIDIALTTLSIPLGILAYFVITKYNAIEHQINELEIENQFNEVLEIEQSDKVSL